MATANPDYTARLIETESGTEEARIRHGDNVECLAFSPDGRWLATASRDDTARLIETESGSEVARIEHSGDVNSVAFSSDSRWLATASDDNTARLFWADPQRAFDILCKNGRSQPQPNRVEHLHRPQQAVAPHLPQMAQLERRRAGRRRGRFGLTRAKERRMSRSPQTLFILRSFVDSDG